MDKRLMALDLGTKRVGVALSDPLNIIASAYKTINYVSKELLIKEICKIIDEKNVGTVVFGVPYTLSGNESKKTLETKDFIQWIGKQLPNNLKMDTIDESLSSKEAERICRQMGIKPFEHKEKIDMIAAQHILRSYMDEHFK